MADSKLSELTSATSLTGSETLYLVQSGASKKVTVDTLFGNAGNVTLTGNIQIESNVQSLGAAGIIDLNIPITHLSSPASDGTLTIPTGVEGQIKILTMISDSGGTYTLYGNIANSSNVTFNNVGDTATLLYTNSKWNVIGGTADVVAVAP